MNQYNFKSSYTLLDGIHSIKDIADTAQKDSTIVGTIEDNYLPGLIQVSQLAKKLKKKPLFGVEFNVVDSLETVKNSFSGNQKLEKLEADLPKGYFDEEKIRFLKSKSKGQPTLFGEETDDEKIKKAWKERKEEILLEINKERIEAGMKEFGEGYYKVKVFAKNEVGLKNLLTLNYESNARGIITLNGKFLNENPRIDLDLLYNNSRGLGIILSGDNSPIHTCVSNEEPEKAIKIGKEIDNKFENVFVEFYPHDRKRYTEDNIKILNFVKENFPHWTVIVNNNPRYFNEGERFARHVVGTKKSGANFDAVPAIEASDPFNGIKFYDTYRMLDSKELKEIFEKRNPEFGDVSQYIKNIDKVSDLIQQISVDTTNKTPEYKIPEGNEGLTYRGYIEKMSLEKLEQLISKYKLVREDQREEYITRLNRELDDIEDLNFESYFLITMQLLKYAREELNEITGPGRGSAAGSLACYLMGITDVDPIKYKNLMTFERFITKERIIGEEFCTFADDTTWYTYKDILDIEKYEFESKDGDEEWLVKYCESITTEENKDKVNFERLWFEKATSKGSLSLLRHLIENKIKMYNTSRSYLFFMSGLSRSGFDPLKENFEFNYGTTGDFPDIDCDFKPPAYNVVDYLIKEYKKENSCHVGTYGTLQIKSLIREVLKSLGIAEQELKTVFTEDAFKEFELKKLSQRDYDDIIEQFEEKGIQYDGEDYKDLFKKILELELPENFMSFLHKYPQIFGVLPLVLGNFASFGVHASGKISSKIPLAHCVSTFVTPNGDLCTAQTEGGTFRELTDLRIPKFDLLKIKNLLMVDEVRKAHGISIDDFINSVDDYDPKTFDLVDKGDIGGIFQMTSGSALQVGDYMLYRPFKEKGIKCDTIQRLSDMSACNRPGPIKNGSPKMYYEAIVGIKKPNYFGSKIVEEILGPTHGTLLYQEQFILLAEKRGGFTTLEANKLRKTLAKRQGKSKEELEKMEKDLEDKFLAGCSEKVFQLIVDGKPMNTSGRASLEKLEKDIRENKIRSLIGAKEFVYKEVEGTLDIKSGKIIWQMILANAGYAFNSAHSISYAYVSAWGFRLLARYPAEYLASTIKYGEFNQSVIDSLKNAGISIDVPNINKSEEDLVGVNEDRKIYWGLAAKFVTNGKGELRDFIEKRKKIGPFNSISQIRQAYTNKEWSNRGWITLTRIGTMDSLYNNRLKTEIIIKEKVIEDLASYYERKQKYLTKPGMLARLEKKYGSYFSDLTKKYKEFILRQSKSKMEITIDTGFVDSFQIISEVSIDEISELAYKIWNLKEYDKEKDFFKLLNCIDYDSANKREMEYQLTGTYFTEVECSKTQYLMHHIAENMRSKYKSGKIEKITERLDKSGRIMAFIKIGNLDGSLEKEMVVFSFDWMKLKGSLEIGRWYLFNIEGGKNFIKFGKIFNEFQIKKNQDFLYTDLVSKMEDERKKISLEDGWKKFKQ